MNIYDFFDSPEEAERRQSSGRPFNAVECAITVFMSSSRTLTEKHEAYRAIIAEYPDMDISKVFPKISGSCHEEMEYQIHYQERILENFLTSEPCAVYQASWYVSDRGREEGELFTTYGEALADALDRIYSDACAESQYLREETHVPNFDICKRFLGTDKKISASLSLTGEISSIYESGAV